MRFLLLLLLFLPAVAFGDSSLPEQPKKPLVVGQSVMNFGETAGSTAKNGIYFFAVLLLGFGLWKKYDQRKNPQNTSKIKVTSRTAVGARAALLIAEVEGRRYLLAQTPDNLNLVSELKGDNFQEILSEEFADAE